MGSWNLKGNNWQIFIGASDRESVREREIKREREGSCRCGDPSADEVHEKK